jgi:hypothetical protein
MHPGSGPLRLGALLAVAVQGGENTADIGGRPCTLVVRVAFDTPLRLHRFHLIGACDLPPRVTQVPLVGNGRKPRSGAVITASARRRPPRRWAGRARGARGCCDEHEWKV